VANERERVVRLPVAAPETSPPTTSPPGSTRGPTRSLQPRTTIEWVAGSGQAMTTEGIHQRARSSWFDKLTMKDSEAPLQNRRVPISLRGEPVEPRGRGTHPPHPRNPSP